MPSRVLTDNIGEPPSSKAKHDWLLLLNGDRWHLKRGVDFTCKPNSMQVQAHTAAAKYDGYVETECDENDDVIIQFFENE